MSATVSLFSVGSETWLLLVIFCFVVRVPYLNAALELLVVGDLAATATTLYVLLDHSFPPSHFAFTSHPLKYGTTRRTTLSYSKLWLLTVSSTNPISQTRPHPSTSCSCPLPNDINLFSYHNLGQWRSLGV